MGRFLPHNVQRVVSPLLYPVLRRGFALCVAESGDAAACLRAYERSVWLVAALAALAAAALALAVALSVRRTVRLLRARRRTLDDAANGTCADGCGEWRRLADATHAIDAETHAARSERVLARVADAPERGLLALGGELSAAVSGEAVLLLGGGTAVLLQLAHPFVAWAIAEHSYTLGATQRRFANTFRAVFALAFGSAATAAAAARRVSRTHQRVLGRVPRSLKAVYCAGDAYAATDHAAAAWVLATAHRRPAEHVRAVCARAECARARRALPLPPARVRHVGHRRGAHARELRRL